MEKTITIFKEANLAINDIAALLDVSRVTVSGWMNKGRLPHRFIQDKVEALANAVSLQVSAGNLPLVGVKRKDRFARIKTLIDAA